MIKYKATIDSALADLATLDGAADAVGHVSASALQVEDLVRIFFEHSEAGMRAVAMLRMFDISDLYAGKTCRSPTYEHLLQLLSQRIGFAHADAAQDLAACWIATIHGEWLARKMVSSIDSELMALRGRPRTPL